MTTTTTAALESFIVRADWNLEILAGRMATLARELRAHRAAGDVAVAALVAADFEAARRIAVNVEARRAEYRRALRAL
jgi:hypothetical protein